MSQRSLKAELQEATQGELVIVRPSKLAEANTTGVVATGKYEKAEPNKFNKAKKDYFLRNEATNTLYIINSTKSLENQMGQIKPEDNVSAWFPTRIYLPHTKRYKNAK